MDSTVNAGRFANNIRVELPGQVSESASRFIRKRVAPVVHALFRPTATGWENLPTDRPYLLVANHAGGVGLAELLSLAVLWNEKFGTTRRLAGFALPLGFVVWPISAIHRQLGTIPSNYRAAYDALDKGSPLLVFPGGDHESLKPVWQNGRVDFAGRVGFLRIAREKNVDIVPIGIRNGALTAPILFRSKAMAWILVVPRLLGVKRWGVSALGVLGAGAIIAFAPVSLPWRLAGAWLWLGSPLTFLPIVPATLRFEIGEPLPAATLFGADATDEQLRAALTHVQQAVQNLVTPRKPSPAPSP